MTGATRSNLFRLGIVLACTAAGAAWLAWKGPTPVIRITTPLAEPAPFWYMLSAFPVLGFLVADLLDLYRREGLRRGTVELAFQIALLVALSSLRLGVRLPISGHALLLSYFLFRRRLFGPSATRWHRIEWLIGLGLLAVVAYPKLFWWRDPVTLLTGIALGAVLAAVSRRVAPKNRAPGSIPPSGAGVFRAFRR